MSFGNELNNYMRLLNCNAKEICKIADISPALISRYLNNKRTPKSDSKYLIKIVEALYQIAINRNIEISKDSIMAKFKKAIDFHDIDYDDFVKNFNTIQNELNILTVDLAKSLGYDASFLSRIKSKERRPANLENFIDIFKKYIISSCKTAEKKESLASLFKCNLNELDNDENFKKLLVNWLITPHNDENKNIFNFLTKIDTFDLNDYIGKDFESIKVPTVPVIFKSSKVFWGIEGRKQAEGQFLKTTLLSKSNEPIFFYSNLPISKISKDDEFKKKWIIAMTMLLKRGLHLNIVHNIDRPISEMLLGLESWLPIYMTGSISPYYFKTPPSNFFYNSHCTSGSIALTSECIKYNEKRSKFYLTTKKDELTYEKAKSKYLLSKAKPLMKIFKEKDKNEFKNFIEQYNNEEIQIISKSSFKNIDFWINENKWIIINKKLSPEIHFVIYNQKLIDTIKAFLSD